MLAGSAALPGQETNTVGPPALKDFQLPGERTTPPVQAPQPTPPVRSAPAPAAERPAPRATAPAPAREAPAPAARPVERPAAALPSAPPATRAPAPSAAEAAPAPAPLPQQAQPQPLPQAVPPAATAPAPLPAAPAADAGSWSWLWLAIPALLGLGAFFALGRRRRPVRKAASKAQRAAAPAPPPPAPAPPPAPRARLEVQFLPARAASTDSAAMVEFELVLKNVGDEPARNIRIDTRMFNASAQADIATFLKGAIHDKSGSPHVTIEPGAELRLKSAIGLPLEELREIEIQGRRLFVPVVASNVAYDWGEDGAGRSSLSWLVGRESENPAAKMGGFRLDLGPRIYRSVGVRALQPAMVA